MIIVNKNEGEKIPYEQSGKSIIFDDSLMVNCSKFQRDWDIHIDICKDDDGNMTTGIGRSYVAEVDIPAREYRITEASGEGEGGEATPVPLDMDKVTLTLWALV